MLEEYPLPAVGISSHATATGPIRLRRRETDSLPPPPIRARGSKTSPPPPPFSGPAAPHAVYSQLIRLFNLSPLEIHLRATPTTKQKLKASASHCRPRPHFCPNPLSPPPSSPRAFPSLPPALLLPLRGCLPASPFFSAMPEGVSRSASEHVMNYRGGSVLGKKTILKSDHFPGCQNKCLTPQIDGAPNYRQAGSLRVHGVAIPTIDGIRNVLNHIGARKETKQKRVLWHNLREEPVIYVNHRPFVLRDVERPFSNLEYTGINRARLEQMEFRLKEDILLEASRYGNKILVTDELPDGQMVDQWEPLVHDSIKTPLEVYEKLQKEGYLVGYERIPITDEKSPKEGDFDDLVHGISQANLDTEIVFNCQMGRGRTTTGMVIATLVYLNRIGASGISRSTSIGKVFASGTDVTDHAQSSEELMRGEYAVIRSLIRVLEGGAEAKKQVDKVIDMCDSMQNLREAIATYGNSIPRQPDEMKREALLSFFVEYLERYYFLICFAVFIHTERTALHSISSDQISFSEWMRARPELYSILRRLLRRDPMGALRYSISRPSLTNIVESINGCSSEIDMIAAMRNGEVLGSRTVLKSDHCPGCQNLNLPERVDGAPNFWKVPGFPVYGVANPTIDGIRAVIQQIKSKGGNTVLWHNMREEPVIYINGKPFVLREVERPYKNMLEYTGIDCERVERMEARLKADIVREAERFGGAIMVIQEMDDGQIFDAWEHIDAASIQTPLEVYKSLEFEGLPIKYARVPITDGKAPKSSDFDKIASNIALAPNGTSFVFNCQMGRGRTTTGTVIACLVKLRIDYGKPIRMQRDDSDYEHLDVGSSSGEEVIGDYGSPVSSFLKSVDRHDTHHTFGIDDILLLRKITRLFDNGIESREVLDSIIDRCSALQNIRQAVLQYRKVINQQHVELRVKRVALNRSAEYLERYFKLIAFSAYLGSEAFDGFCGQGETKVFFKTWLHKRPEIQTMKWSIRLRPGRFFTAPEEPKALYESQHSDVVMDAIVKSRNGSVLGKGSILKMYFFPGQKTSSCMQFKGTPNVYKVDAYPVYSMATPTIDGAREVLSYLGAQDPSSTDHTQKVIIVDLREEAVVYINGSPFVLRELDRPVDTLKHVGISGPMVEHMEARMKEDIFAEVTQSGGQMLLHREEFNPISNQTSVIGYWEKISLEYVKTPAEVFATLKDEGYSIEYKRIPLSSEREALAVDVDAMQYCQDEFARYYLFISHTGFGGVSYAMAITCLGLGANKKFATEQTVETHFVSTSPIRTLPSPSGEDALKQGDYRDILSLTRVLVHGPKSKHEVDYIVERCSGAGHLRDDILHYKRELDKCPSDDEERRSFLLDMGMKALRRYFFLITYRSYLYCTSPIETSFSAWMDARPELGHLCDNLRLDK